MIARLAAAIAAFLALAAAPAPSPGVQALDRHMRELVAEGRLGGAVFLVARRGRIEQLQAYGYRALEIREAMATDDLFLIASMTKPVTGVAMMILYDEGRWRLDDPVAKHIPEFEGLMVAGPAGLEPQARPMTMRELMSHTAGFDANEAAAYRAVALRDRTQPMQAMIDKLAKLPLATQPGTAWRYGPGADVQAYLVEKLSGQPFEVFLQRRIFDPLRMKDTGFWPVGEPARRAGRIDPAKLGRLSRMVTYGPDGQALPAPDLTDPSARPPYPSGSGGLMTTATDYWRFCQMLQNGGELAGRRILKPQTAALMRRNVLPDGRWAGGQPGWGFGLDMAVLADPRVAATPQAAGSYSWSGGSGTWFWVDPSRDLVVVGMTHGLGPKAPDLRALAVRDVYEAAKPAT